MDEFMQALEQAAFPSSTPPDATGMTMHTTGMTLRDYFAAKAMIGLMPAELIAAQTEDSLRAMMDGMASVCYSMADAMLKARQA